MHTAVAGERHAYSQIRIEYCTLIGERPTPKFTISYLITRVHRFILSVRLSMWLTGWLAGRRADWLESDVACERATNKNQHKVVCTVPILFAFLAFPCLWRVPGMTYAHYCLLYVVGDVWVNMNAAIVCVCVSVCTKYDEMRCSLADENEPPLNK